ncbi:MAG TPA: hypothetical protein VF657_22675 [Actinoplanes sp.]
MSTITAAPGGGNWSAGATWVGGVAPTAADDVVLDATANGATNVVIDAGAVARSLDCTGYPGILTHTAGVALTLGDATAGAGSVALKMVAGMTYTLGSATTSTVAFVSTSATQQSITTGGKTLGNWTINAPGGSYILGDANTVGTTSTVTVTAGTFNTGTFGCSWGNFASSNTNTRSLIFGTAAITLTGGGGTFDVLTTTGLTLSALSSTINMPANGYFKALGSYGTVTWLALGPNGQSQPFTCVNLTIVGGSAKTGDFNTAGNITITGTLTLAGNSAVNRIKVHSSLPGNPRSLIAANVAVSSTDFLDIAGAGAGNWDLSAATGGVGNCGGNTGIIFTPAATQTHVAGAGGNWSDAAQWTSRVPLPQDDVVVDVNTTGTLVADMPRLGRSIDFTGFAGTAAFTSQITQMFGSLILDAAMTITGTFALSLSGRGSHTVTSNGKTLTQPLTVNAPAMGTYTLRDALTTAGALTLTLGTLATAGHPVGYLSLVVTGGVLRAGAGPFAAFF